MAKGGGFPGGMNMQQMMKQAQKMQQDMARMQEELGEREYTAQAGGGVVKATVYGRKELKNIEIDPTCVDPDDVEMLQDLITAAVNEAIRLADEQMNEQMGQLTGGMKLGF
ncbi:YbaB/EbfC family nucleoid-associated protein [Eubacteriales bacterium OttesenSCG-928-K08]|nr:YbaB/EbfC family nucleoid-associated protein [Eubacteriales bacterium OttesenSCG-928-K08]